MRALILSDIHANLEALLAVLDHVHDRGGFDVIWCLGDTVGYGPDPAACISLLHRHPFVGVLGNHDQAAIGRMSTQGFTPVAEAAALWTRGQLSAEDQDFLGKLPLVATCQQFTLVHGSLRSPLLEYLLDTESARATLALLTTRYCLVGHSHIPFLCREEEGPLRFDRLTEGQVFKLGDQRCIINPGGVGQPRDHDPRTNYAVFDSSNETLEQHRVVYDIEKTQAKMRAAKLPQGLIQRLTYGV